MIALCVVTHPKTYRFLKNMMDSLQDQGALPPIYFVAGDYGQYSIEQKLWMTGQAKVISHYRATWEAGAIQLMNEQAPPEVTEFVFLQDTFEFKPGMFQDFWAHQTNSLGRTIWFTQNKQMYAGKFRREVLNTMPPWDWPMTKGKAVAMERFWSDSYAQHDNTVPILWEQIPDGTEEFEMFGRLNVRCENQWLIKWKGTHCGNLGRRLTEIDEEGKV